MLNNKQKAKLTPTTIKLTREPAAKENHLKYSDHKQPSQNEKVYIVMSKSDDVAIPKPTQPPAPPPLIIANPIQTKPPIYNSPPPQLANTKKKEPTGIIYVSEKKNMVKPAQVKPMYYSSDEEEFGDIKKIYKDDYRARNFFCCNCLKGRFAACCSILNCCEWFYGCPLWFYILFVLFGLALFATFWTLLAFVIYGIHNPTKVTVTLIYNKTWGVYTVSCATPPCYSTSLITAGYMSGQNTPLHPNHITMFSLIIFISFLINIILRK